MGVIMAAKKKAGKGKKKVAKKKIAKKGKKKAAKKKPTKKRRKAKAKPISKRAARARLARKAWQKQGWSLEGGVHEEQVGKDRLEEGERTRGQEQVDRRCDESPQGAQDQRLRGLQEGHRFLQSGSQELREVGRCRWRLPRITRCTTTCHFNMYYHERE